MGRVGLFGLAISAGVPLIPVSRMSGSTKSSTDSDPAHSNPANAWGTWLNPRSHLRPQGTAPPGIGSRDKLRSLGSISIRDYEGPS
jgi:hypothetical protein